MPVGWVAVGVAEGVTPGGKVAVAVGCAWRLGLQVDAGAAVGGVVGGPGIAVGVAGDGVREDGDAGANPACDGSRVAQGWLCTWDIVF